MMAGNSLDSVLAWMKDNSRMLNWGLIVAVERRKANLLIIQEYIRRFGVGSYLKAIKGEVPIVEDKWMEYIHEFVLDVPRLSFENADLNDSKAMLSMAVMGGSQVTLKKESDGWKANKVDEIDPLQGPKLYLDLLLNQVPGDVDVDGRIKLDLSKSDNFRLTFGQTAHEQRVGGAFFKDLFNQLPDDKRVYPLGYIQHGTNEMLDPKSFELRTQKNNLDITDGSGAILALVRTIGRNGGNFPGEGFKYLIPDDAGKDYSATVLFNRIHVLFGAVLLEMPHLLKNVSFDYLYGDDVTTVQVAGDLDIPRVPPGGFEFGDSTVSVNGFVFLADGANPFLISSVNNRLSVQWDSTARAAGVIHNQHGSSKDVVIQLTLKFKAEYEIAAGADGRAELSRPEYDVGFSIVELKDVGSKPSPDYPSDDECLSPGPYSWGYGEQYYTRNLRAILDEAFKPRFSPAESITAVIDETIKLNFGQAIQGTEIYGPSDVGVFGRINPTQTTFVVSPMEPLLKQGSTQQFTTDPVVPGVQWKVENLVEGSGSPGLISASGIYQAPATITGRYTRVRVTATAPGTGYFSSALVTVVANDLTVNPLIQTCDVGATVELSAGQLGTGALTWSIKNPVPGESGEVRLSDKPEGDHTYHHGPVVTNKTFVLDEIEVKSGAGSTRSMHVLALQKQPGVTVGIDSLDLAKGQVQLKATVNGTAFENAEWSLPLGGPGDIDATGLYRAEPTATERFALIFALVDGGPFGKFEGYLILPLPLLEFPKLLEVLSQ